MAELGAPPEGAEDLLDELDLGSARGGRRPSAGPVRIDVVRGLTEADLAGLAEVPAPGTGIAVLETLRTSHHQLAQLLAKGLSQAEAGLITGYSGTYISRLVTQDPAFRELLAHYSAEREAVFVDVLERVRTLGLEVNDLLLERLRNEPNKWTNQQLMDLHKETLSGLVRGGGGPGSGAAPAIGALNVTFVAPEPRSAGTVVIDQAGRVVEAEDE